MLIKYDPNKIEYKDVLMFFRDEITLYEYKYTLEDNTIILLKIKEKHFCKLLALDELVPSLYKRRMYLDFKYLIQDEARHAKAFEGLLNRYFGK